MPKPLRLFIAIELNKEIKNLIKEVQNHFINIDSGIKWVRPENAHITLKFLGDTTEEEIKDITTALNEIANSFKPFSVTLSDLGAFPSLKHPSIIWIGAKENPVEMQNLSSNVENRMEQLGFEKENRPFKLHITIGRVKNHRDISSFVSRLETYKITSMPTIHCDSLSLFNSTLTPAGPEYEIIEKRLLT
ncbi:MAG: RNA 2',3'-cyclic phosphodiesterase [Candidatus Omnitrophica bacterium]|nr:RNA 2',3'-cyclic phosphodiesterase [Candidatus Omnitrophota bacterium]